MDKEAIFLHGLMCCHVTGGYLRIVHSSLQFDLVLDATPADPNLGQLVLQLEPELASAWIKRLSFYMDSCVVM
jgi:hypothetical protein